MGNTAGSFMLKALVTVFGFNMIYTGIKLIFTLLNQYLDIVEMYGHGWLFSLFVDFMLSLWSWYFLLVTDAMALAIILALGLIYEAYETKWR